METLFPSMYLLICDQLDSERSLIIKLHQIEFGKSISREHYKVGNFGHGLVDFVLHPVTKSLIFNF